MCGRYTLKTERESLIRALDLPADALPQDFPARYNIAPSQLVPVLRFDDGMHVVPHRWGLVPAWAKDASIGNRLINARSETLDQRSAFRDSLVSRRCLVLADGFYEWQDAGRGRRKIPHYIRRPDEAPFTFAGLWSAWRDRSGAEDLLTCTIVTGPASEKIGRIHDRMPVIVPAGRREAWLDPDHEAGDALTAILKEPETLEAYAVSTRVNSPDNDDEACLLPAEQQSLF